MSHAGYLLVGVVAAYHDPMAVGAVYFYLLVYLIASFAVFGVMTYVCGENDADQELEHYADLAKANPFLAVVLAIGLGSLAGIPPLAGFIGKLLVFVAAFHAGLYVLLGIAIVGVVISIYYYFGWIKAAVFPFWSGRRTAEGVSQACPRLQVGLLFKLVLGGLTIATVILGVYQGGLIPWLAAR